MMDDTFYTDILEENKAAVKQAVKDAMLNSITQKFQWELPQALQEAVNEFIKDEIIPEVRKELLENKDAMVAMATDLIKAVPAEIGKAMQEKVAENLSSSYTLKNMVDQLFR